MSNKLGVILAAALGGVAPNLFKIALIATGGPAAFPGVGFVLTYTFGLILLAGLGIGTALALKETSSRKAIFIGLGLPAFLQVSASNISQAVATKAEMELPKVTQVSWGFVGTAYAEPTRRSLPAASTESAGQRTLEITSTGESKPQTVTFNSKKGTTTKKLASEDFDNGVNRVSIPEGAESYSLNYEGAKSKNMPIDATDKKSTVEVEVKQDKWTGLWQAIGANPQSEYKVEAHKQD